MHTVVVLTDADCGLLTARGISAVCIPHPSPQTSSRRQSAANKVVVWSGRMVAVKRLDFLLMAFAVANKATTGWSLRLVGDGPERSSVVDQISKLGLVDNVELTGHRNNVFAELASASIFALTSDVEGWGLSLAEAGSVGLCAISRNCGPGIQLLLASTPQCIVDTDDPNEFGARLSELMTNLDLRRALGDRFREHLCNFSEASAVAHWLRILQPTADSVGRG